MKKVYVKPCSLSVAVDPHQTLGGPGSPAKMNPFADDEEEAN